MNNDYSLLCASGCEVRNPGGEASVQLDADPAPARGLRLPPRHAQGAPRQADHAVLGKQGTGLFVS